jgi:hypothetical protein
METPKKMGRPRQTPPGMTYYEHNKERIAQYYQDNKAARSAYSKAYMAAHVEKYREYWRNYRRARPQVQQFYRPVKNGPKNVAASMLKPQQTTDDTPAIPDSVTSKPITLNAHNIKIIHGPVMCVF